MRTRSFGTIIVGDICVQMCIRDSSNNAAGLTDHTRLPTTQLPVGKLQEPNVARAHRRTKTPSPHFFANKDATLTR